MDPSDDEEWDAIAEREGANEDEKEDEEGTNDDTDLESLDSEALDAAYSSIPLPKLVKDGEDYYSNATIWVGVIPDTSPTNSRRLSVLILTSYNFRRESILLSANLLLDPWPLTDQNSTLPSRMAIPSKSSSTMSLSLSVCLLSVARRLCKGPWVLSSITEANSTVSPLVTTCSSRTMGIRSTDTIVRSLLPPGESKNFSDASSFRIRCKEASLPHEQPCFHQLQVFRPGLYPQPRRGCQGAQHPDYVLGGQGRKWHRSSRHAATGSRGVDINLKRSRGRLSLSRNFSLPSPGNGATLTALSAMSSTPLPLSEVSVPTASLRTSALLNLTRPSLASSLETSSALVRYFFSVLILSDLTYVLSTLQVRNINVRTSLLSSTSTQMSSRTSNIPPTVLLHSRVCSPPIISTTPTPMTPWETVFGASSSAAPRPKPLLGLSLAFCRLCVYTSPTTLPQSLLSYPSSPTKTRLDFSQRKETLGLLSSLPAASSWVSSLVAPTRALTALISRMPPSLSTSGNLCRNSSPVPIFIGRIFPPFWLELRLQLRFIFFSYALI